MECEVPFAPYLSQNIFINSSLYDRDLKSDLAEQSKSWLGIPIRWAYVIFPPGWNRVKVAAKKQLGRIPTVPLCSRQAQTCGDYLFKIGKVMGLFSTRIFRKQKTHMNYGLPAGLQSFIKTDEILQGIQEKYEISQ